MNKAVVIPHHIYMNMKNSEPKPSNLHPEHQNLARVEQELKDILEDNSKSHEERRILYQQIYQKYLSAYDSIVKPNVNNLPTSTTQEQPLNSDTSVDPLLTTIRDSLHKPYRSKAENMYNSLGNIEGLSWDKKGRINIDGKIIASSNIADIIVDMMKVWKRPPPVGWSELRTKLQSINFPSTYIYNPKRISELRPTREVSINLRRSTSEPITLSRIMRRQTRTRPYTVLTGKDKNAAKWTRY